MNLMEEKKILDEMDLVEEKIRKAASIQEVNFLNLEMLVLSDRLLSITNKTSQNYEVSYGCK